jgi:DNA-directed RNA polymerase sigma subunit (sigma70/sigma32)
MIRSDVRSHQDAMLTLALLDRYTSTNEYSPMTLGEVSKATSIPRNTVSKIERRALAKLRKDPEVEKVLSMFLG